MARRGRLNADGRCSLGRCAPRACPFVTPPGKFAVPRLIKDEHKNEQHRPAAGEGRERDQGREHAHRRAASANTNTNTARAASANANITPQATAALSARARGGRRADGATKPTKPALSTSRPAFCGAAGGGALGFCTKDCAYKQSLDVLAPPYGKTRPGGGSMTTDRVSDTKKNAEEKVSRRIARFLHRLQCAVLAGCCCCCHSRPTEVVHSSAHGVACKRARALVEVAARTA